jgi:hypothetical protein
MRSLRQFAADRRAGTEARERHIESRPASPAVNLPALNEALDAAAAATYITHRGDNPAVAGRMLRQAFEEAERAFPAGSREFEAFAVVLASVTGGPQRQAGSPEPEAEL